MPDEDVEQLKRKVSDYEDALKDVVSRLRWCSIARMAWDVDKSYRVAEDILRKYRVYA